MYRERIIMASYKSTNRTKRSSTLVKTIEPIQAGTDRYGELKLMIEKLFCYSVNRIRNFPRDQKWPAGVGSNIMNYLNQGLELVFEIAAYNPSYDREAGLRKLSIKIKMIETQIKAAYDCRFINNKRLEVWTRQLVEIDNFAIGLAMYLQKEGREKASRKNKTKVSVAKAKTEQAEEAVQTRDKDAKPKEDATSYEKTKNES